MKDLIKTITENVTGSVKTTILGIIMFAAGLVALFWVELGAGFWPPIELMALGLVVACLKDPRKNKRQNNQKKEGGNTLPMIAILISVLVTSCATERRCAEKYSTSSTSDSVRIEVREIIRDTVIHIPGDSVQIFIQNPCDSLGKLIPGIFRAEGSGGKASSIVSVTGNGISVECICDEENRIIKSLQREVSHLRNRKSETVTVYKSRFGFWKLVGLCSFFFLAGGIITQIIVKRFFKK